MTLWSGKDCGDMWQVFCWGNFAEMFLTYPDTQCMVYLPIHLGSLVGVHVGIHTTYIECFGILNFYTETCLFLLVGCLHQGLGPPTPFSQGPHINSRC